MVSSKGEKLPQLKLGTGWVRIEILSESDVQLTFKGYVPWVHVKVSLTGLEYCFYIGAKSLAEQLEKYRQANAGRVKGVVVKVRKASMDKMAPYECEQG